MCITCGRSLFSTLRNTGEGSSKRISQIKKLETREMTKLASFHITSKWHSRTKSYILTLKSFPYSLQFLFHCFETEVAICLFLTYVLGPEIGFSGCRSQWPLLEIGSQWDGFLGNQTGKVNKAQRGNKKKITHLSGLLVHSPNHSEGIMRKNKSTFHC